MHKTCKAPVQPMPVSDYIWETIAINKNVTFPESYKVNKYIPVIVEYVTGYVIATLVKDLSTNTLVRNDERRYPIRNSHGSGNQILIINNKRTM